MTTFNDIYHYELVFETFIKDIGVIVHKCKFKCMTELNAYRTKVVERGGYIIDFYPL